MKYRPEIDGLRAIAVLSVLIYHAKFALASGVLISGGFLGVDIFFVISGYLITKIIVQDIRNSRFSYRDFYDRRARRILPALFAVIVASTPFAWLWMLPDQLVEYSQSIIGALFFSSNWVFLSQDSYTAEPSALKPFLHTWSLGIEEQFYILLPIILLVIVKRYSARKTLWLAVVGFVASLLFAQGIARHFPDQNFFLLTSRAWELLAGSIVAFIELDHRKDLGQSKHAPVISGIALAIIIASLLLFDESTLHPSLLTALPVLSCAALIAFSNGQHLTNKFLSGDITVKLGLISYSLYLWHFPLFAFYRLHLGEPSFVVKITLSIASIILAIISYRLIEKPFRKRELISTGHSTAILASTFMAITAFQISVVHFNGYSQRLGNVEDFISAAKAIRLQNGASADTPTDPIVALGDSHAGILSSSLKAIAAEHDRPFVQIVQDGCPLVLGVKLYTDGKLVPRCENIAQARVDAIKHFRQGVFFYSGRFALYEEGKRFAQEPGYPVLLTHRSDGKPSPQQLLVSTAETVQMFLNEGIRLVLVYPIPEMGFDVPKHFKDRFQKTPDLQLKRELNDNRLSIEKAQYLARTANVISAFDNIPDHPNLIRLKPADVLCDSTNCYAHDDEILYYYDDNHLSPQAVTKVLNSILPTLSERGWLD